MELLVLGWPRYARSSLEPMQVSQDNFAILFSDRLSLIVTAHYRCYLVMMSILIKHWFLHCELLLRYVEWNTSIR